MSLASKVNRLQASAALLNPAPGSHEGTCWTGIAVSHSTETRTKSSLVRKGKLSTRNFPGTAANLRVVMASSALWMYGSFSGRTSIPYATSNRVELNWLKSRLVISVATFIEADNLTSVYVVPNSREWRASVSEGSSWLQLAEDEISGPSEN